MAGNDGAGDDEGYDGGNVSDWLYNSIINIMVAFQKQREWIKRVNRLVAFMNYQWEADQKWKDYQKSKAGKQNKDAQ